MAEAQLVQLRQAVENSSEAIFMTDPQGVITFLNPAFTRLYGYGAAEVVNIRAPSYLIKKGITALPCIGDGRQSGTSGSPSILNASPEAATGGGLAPVRHGHPLRIDHKKPPATPSLDRVAAGAFAAPPIFPRHLFGASANSL